MNETNIKGIREDIGEMLCDDLRVRMVNNNAAIPAAVNIDNLYHFLEHEGFKVIRVNMLEVVRSKEPMNALYMALLAGFVKEDGLEKHRQDLERRVLEGKPNYWFHDTTDQIVTYARNAKPDGKSVIVILDKVLELDDGEINLNLAGTIRGFVSHMRLLVHQGFQYKVELDHDTSPLYNTFTTVG